MKRTLCLLPFALLAACSFKTHTIPGAAPAFAAADFQVLGETNHEECGTYLFGIDFGGLFSGQRGIRLPTVASDDDLLGGLVSVFFSGGSPEEGRALYHALDKMPEATHLLQQRTHTTTTGLVLAGLPLFGQRCAAIEARGLTIGDKPAPGKRLSM